MSATMATDCRCSLEDDGSGPCAVCVAATITKPLTPAQQSVMDMLAAGVREIRCGYTKLIEGGSRYVTIKQLDRMKLVRVNLLTPGDAEFCVVHLEHR